ncbi:hypothetical protein BLNAU_14685 [Blattamonas nauphoetae]|uniref:Uncharacterized protein n=1 Tax=Blattamonas nauphoetae TaxID=2049346 RepID=A0ABQ9XJL4_9EUKA|nr:hypothetical protein BLNAU_14685 [Blattamonas nauphoetae]
MTEDVDVAECWTNTTGHLDMDVRERRKKSEKEKRETEETTGRKRKNLLPHISPPSSTTADDTRRRFWSLSPTTPQLMTSCPATPPKANPDRTRGKGKIDLTPRRAQKDRQNADTADLVTCHVISSVTVILGEYKRVGIIAFAHSMHRCCFVTAGTTGDTAVPVESIAVEAETDDERAVENRHESGVKKAVIFRSLVATIKLQPAFDDSLVAKAVKFLESVTTKNRQFSSGFLRSLGRTPDESLTCFVQCVVVLVSTDYQVITAAAMKILDTLIWRCSAKLLLTFIKADLISLLIISLNPQSLSFDEAVEIHIHLMKSIRSCLRLATRDGLELLKITDDNEQQAVHETVLQQVVVPSEEYIWHLCVNRYSIVDGDQSDNFLTLLTALLEISPSYPPAMDIVVNIPVFLTIPSCLTLFETVFSTWTFLYDMNDAKRKWNNQSGDVQQMGKIVQRLLRMEGTEDVIEEKLPNDRKEFAGIWLVDKSIEWNSQHGMNLPAYW